MAWVLSNRSLVSSSRYPHPFLSPRALPFTHQSMGQEGGGEGREDATTRAPTVGRTKGAQRKDEEILCLPSLPSLLS